MESQMMVSDTLSDQFVSATGAARSALGNIHPLAMIKRLIPHLLAWAKRYWVWLIYFIVFRKLVRMIRGRSGKRSKRSHSKRHQHFGNTADFLDTSSSNTATTEASALAPYFSASSSASPGTNQVIVGDGVIVVNRNDRYVEVYERKNVAKVDNVDDQVEALLQEFASRSKK